MPYKLTFRAHVVPPLLHDQTNMLYDKTSDSQEGAISMLIEDMAEQQLKEAVIGYMMLFLSGGTGGSDDASAGVNQAQLDLMCEEFLQLHFGLKVSRRMY